MADYYVSTTGNDTTGTGAIGAPYATPGKALGVAIAAAVAGFRIFVKADGTYTTTSTTANVSGGVLNFSLTGSTTATNHMVGYTSTVGDGGRFTIQHGTGLAGTVVTFNNANSYNTLQNCEIVGNATSASRAMAGAGRSNRAINIYARAFTGAGGVDIINVNNAFSLRLFRISGGATGNNASLKIDSGGAYVEDGIVEGNAGRGVEWGGVGTLNRIISCNHTTTNGHGFDINSVSEFSGNQLIAYGNAGSGFHQFATTQTLSLTDCVAYGNGVNGFNFNSADALFCYGCAAGGNTSGNFANTPNVNEGFISLASNPYANAASLDFTPGTSLKQISRLFPFLRSSGLSTSYRDIGTIGAQASGGLLRGGGLSGGLQ